MLKFLCQLSFYGLLLVIGCLSLGSYFLYCFYQLPDPLPSLIVEHPPYFFELDEIDCELDSLLDKPFLRGIVIEVSPQEDVQITAVKPTQSISASMPVITKLPLIDKVLVLKSARRLYLLADKEIIKAYSISLGKNPVGAKQQEGDMRTPEGLYWLDWRKKSTKYNLSIHISYPNWRDVKNAKQNNIDEDNLGGMIMLHGTPISAEFNSDFLTGKDWTDGCIALNNQDMQEVWRLVPNDTLIEIKP